MTSVDVIVSYMATAFRNIASRKIFVALQKYCSGDVLDVGGAWFYKFIRNKPVILSSWTSLDVDESRLGNSLDAKHRVVIGDGCAMTFPDASFDTVVNSQVLEHVLEPLRMVDEVARVLKPGGHAIFLIPQTACIHAIPHCYYNFTIFWIREALFRSGLTIIEEHKLGGSWSTILFRMIYFFLQSTRMSSFSSPEFTRNKGFYILFPFMVIYSLLSFPILLLFCLADLSEEPNNHLVIAIKK